MGPETAERPRHGRQDAGGRDRCGGEDLYDLTPGHPALQAPALGGSGLQPGLWFRSILLIDCAFLVFTLLRLELADAGGLFDSLRQFSLAGEHNVASWWSTIVIILAALHAFDGYVLERRTNPRLARAWAMLAFVLLVLSADEMGSLHERADKVLRLGVWVSLLPFATVALGCVAYVLRVMWSIPESRSTAVLVTLGFCVLAMSVPLEYFEHRLEWRGWMRALRGVVEEGCELAGFMLLLRASMSNTRGLFARAEGGRSTGLERPAELNRPTPALDAICALRPWLVAGGVLFGLLLAIVSSSLTDHGRGRPGDWPPAVLFFLASLAAGLEFARPGRGGNRSLAAAALALFASVTAVALSPRHSLHLAFLARPVSLRVTLIVITALGALAALHAAGSLHPRRPARAALAWVSVLLLGAAATAFSSTGPASHAIPALVAVIVFDAAARATCQQKLAPAA
jgi:hypothetical protein